MITKYLVIAIAVAAITLVAIFARAQDSAQTFTSCLRSYLGFCGQAVVIEKGSDVEVCVRGQGWIFSRCAETDRARFGIDVQVCKQGTMLSYFCHGTVGVRSASVSSVAIIAPLEGERVEAGASVNIRVQASAPNGIAEVKFYAGGELIGTDEEAPYQISWTPPNAGAIALMAVAADPYGKVKTSSPVTIIVKRQVAQEAPAPTITSIGQASVSGGGRTTLCPDGSYVEGVRTETHDQRNGVVTFIVDVFCADLPKKITSSYGSDGLIFICRAGHLSVPMMNMLKGFGRTVRKPTSLGLKT